jgi:hypothetical protein
LGKAVIGLHDTGQPTIVLEILAKRIFALASSGEREADRLAAAALAALAVLR